MAGAAWLPAALALLLAVLGDADEFGGPRSLQSVPQVTIVAPPLGSNAAVTGQVTGLPGPASGYKVRWANVNVHPREAHK